MSGLYSHDLFLNIPIKKKLSLIFHKDVEYAGNIHWFDQATFPPPMIYFLIK